MKMLIKVAVYAVILGSLLPSCRAADGSDAVSGGQESAAPTDPDAMFYSFTLEPGTISVGKETPVVVTVVPAKGYKWNPDYPAKFVASAADGLSLGKTEFKNSNGGIVVKGKQAAITLPAIASAAGPYAITLKGGFSVCNETSCKIFRRKSISLSIEAN